MREPAFWYRDAGWQAALLSPLAALYGAVAGARMNRPGARAGVPVICVGNFHLGGAGKTQVTLFLARLLREAGRKPVVLSRGYGGALAGPVAVDPTTHTARDVGDEPLMIARRAPVVVARDRVLGAALARDAGADVIVMDDGLQNPSLHKDVGIVVVDARRGIGNARIFPAGPLRAPLPTQWPHADMLVTIGEGEAAAPIVVEAARRGIPVFHAALVADNAALARLANRKAFAFAGIGDPDRFRRTLEQHGVVVAAQLWFDDHHRYSAGELEAVVADAERAGLVAVTTEKDFARIEGEPALAHLTPKIVALPVRLAFADESGFAQAVFARLGAGAAPGVR